MSIRFHASDVDLWSPSSRAGRFFVAAVRFIEAEYKIASGISEVVSDEVGVDGALVQSFVETLLEIRSQTNNAVMHCYLDPTIAIAAILTERMGVLESNCGAAQPLIALIKRSMPR